jgi:hypothetical protein
LGFDKSRLQVDATDRSSMVLADTRRLQQALLALLDVVTGSLDPEAPLSITVTRQTPNLWCSIRAPRLDTMAAQDRRSHLTAGHEIDIHYVQAVLKAHAGELRFALADQDATGFDVLLPTSSCT